MGQRLRRRVTDSALWPGIRAARRRAMQGAGRAKATIGATRPPGSAMPGRCSRLTTTCSRQSIRRSSMGASGVWLQLLRRQARCILRCFAASLSRPGCRLSAQRFCAAVLPGIFRGKELCRFFRQAASLGRRLPSLWWRWPFREKLWRGGRAVAKASVVATRAEEAGTTLRQASLASPTHFE